MAWITAVLIAVSALLLPAAQAQGRRQPTPPASKPTVYNPDLSSCQPDNLRAGFQRQLQPYADQGEAVL
jgi:hypothetical protein